MIGPLNVWAAVKVYTRTELELWGY